MKAQVDSIVKYACERVTTPLTGIFIVAWLVCNWRAVSVYVFSEEPIDTRLNTVAEILNQNLWDPVIFTGIVLVGYPLLSIPSYALWNWSKIVNRRVQNSFDDYTPPSREEMRSWKNEHREEVNILSARIAEEISKSKYLNDKIEEMKVEIKEYDKRIMDLVQKNVDLQSGERKGKQENETYDEPRDSKYNGFSPSDFIDIVPAKALKESRASFECAVDLIYLTYIAYEKEKEIPFSDLTRVLSEKYGKASVEYTYSILKKTTGYLQINNELMKMGERSYRLVSIKCDIMKDYIDLYEDYMEDIFKTKGFRRILRDA